MSRPKEIAKRLENAEDREFVTKRDAAARNISELCDDFSLSDDQKLALIEAVKRYAKLEVAVFAEAFVDGLCMDFEDTVWEDE